MSTIDFKKPYGVVYGHEVIRYTQEGKSYDARGREIKPDGEEVPPVKQKNKHLEVKIEKATPVDNGREFLKNILSGGPVSKSAVYKEVESNNLDWPSVRQAAEEMGIKRFSQANMEMWQLPEEIKV